MSPIESLPRMLAGMSAGLAFGDQSELNTVVKAVLKNLADAGTLTPTQYVALNAIRFGAVRPLAGAVYPITVIAAGLVDAAELGLSGIQSAYAAVKQFLGLPDTAGPSAPTSLPTHTFFEKMKAFFSFIPEVLSANESISSAQLARLNLDLNQYAQVLLDNTSTTWRTDALAWLRTKATDVDFQSAEIDQLTVAFFNSLSTTPDLTPAELTLLAQERDAFIIDTASGFANANPDFIQKIANVAFNLGQTISSFADIQLIDQAYAAELSDPRLSSSVKAVIEDARAIVQRAGQTVVVQQGIGPNPFNTPGFDPATAPLATGTLKEDRVNTFTAYLPFEAGTGGQAVQLNLQGVGTSTVTVLSGGQELTPINNVVTLVIPEGEKEVQFALRAQELSADATVALVAQLVDGTGTATHLEHPEATITAVNTPAIDYANGLTSQVYTGTESDDVRDLLGSFNYEGHGNGGNDLIFSRADNDQLFGDAGNDSLYGFVGHDQLTGGTGRDLLIADFRDDYTPPSGAVAGQDVVDGGAEDDVVAGTIN